MIISFAGQLGATRQAWQYARNESRDWFQGILQRPVSVILSPLELVLGRSPSPHVSNKATFCVRHMSLDQGLIRGSRADGRSRVSFDDEEFLQKGQS